MATQTSMYNSAGTPPPALSAKTGPTSCEWDKRKDTIIKLYKAHSLKHVMKVMEDRYGFRASKRQYDRKFEHWNVCKNLKAVEKERILSFLDETGPWVSRNISTSPSSHRPTIDLSHYRKAIRHRKAQNRRASSTSQPASKQMSPSVLSSESLSSFSDMEKPPTHSPTPWMLVGVDPAPHNLCDPETSDQVCLRVLEASPHIDNTISVHSSRDEETWSWVDTKSLHRENTRTNSPNERPQTGTSTQSPCSMNANLGTFTLSKTIPLVPYGSVQVNIEKMLKGLYTCISNLADPAIHVSRRQDSSLLPSVGSRFWYEAANGIYLLKVNSDIACSALNKAGRLVDAALSDARSLTVKFMREFFLTLSPGNTKINPLVRKMLLQLLQSRASVLLGAQHHITTISTELLRDGGEQEISDLGLRCCADAIYANRGLSDPSGLATQVECAIIRSHRYNGDIELAAAEAWSLYRKTTRKLQQQQDMPGATFEAVQGFQTQVRLAATELAHIRMAQRGEYYDEAIRMSLVALTGTDSPPEVFDTWPPAPSSVPGQIEDKAAVHTSEDLAKICHELGLVGRAIEWLIVAEGLAVRFIGPGETETATAHISEKLRDLRMELGGVCG